MLKALSISFVLLLGLWLISLYALSPELDTQRELNKVAETGTPGRLSRFDWICFNDNTGSERADFSRAAKTAGFNLDASLDACGIDRSCCSLDSDTMIVGYVTGSEICCVDGRTPYLLDTGNEACIRPSKLLVRREKVAERLIPKGRAWVAQPGSVVYKIGEK